MKRMKEQMLEVTRMKEQNEGSDAKSEENVWKGGSDEENGKEGASNEENISYHARVVNDFDMCSTQVLEQISQSNITRSIQQEYAVSTFDTQ